MEVQVDALLTSAMTHMIVAKLIEDSVPQPLLTREKAPTGGSMVAEGMGICGRDLRVGNGDDLFLRIGGWRDLDHASATLGTVGTFLCDEASESPAQTNSTLGGRRDGGSGYRAPTARARFSSSLLKSCTMTRLLSSRTGRRSRRCLPSGATSNPAWFGVRRL